MDELRVENHPDAFDRCRRVLTCYFLPLMSLLLIFTLITTIVIKFTLEKDYPHIPKESNTPIPFEPTLPPYTPSP